MTVLWILNGCGLQGKGVTGAPIRFHEISKRWATCGITQHVLTTSGGEEMIRSLGSTLPTTVAPSSLFLKKEPCVPFRLWSYLITAFFWKRVRRRLPKPDVIISVSDYFCDIVPALGLKRVHNAKWIAWIHHCETHPRMRPGNRLANELTYRIQRWSFKKIARLADSAWINDTLAGDEIEIRLKAFNISGVKLRRMQNGIDLQAIDAVPEPPSKTVDAVMIGVRPNKGLHDIIPVWKRVNELRPGTTLVLMGGMSEVDGVLREAERLNLKIVRADPNGKFLPPEEYFARIKNAQILFAPSHEEGWGIAVCEAMAAGLPVVSYDLPAYRKIYAGGYTPTPCFQTDNLSLAVVDMLNSPQHIQEMRARGRSVALKYSWNAIAESDLSILKKHFV